MIVGSTYKSNYLVSEDIFVSFQNTFKDFNLLHINDNHAIKHGYQSKIMYGNILNGYISHFVGELLPLKEVIILTQSINFKKPFYLNENISLIASVMDFYESVSIYEISFEFSNSNNVVVANGKLKIKSLVWEYLLLEEALG